MKISVPLLALVAFVFYFGYQAYKKREQLTDQLTGAALNLVKDQAEDQFKVTKDWANDLVSQWKNAWK